MCAQSRAFTFDSQTNTTATKLHPCAELRTVETRQDLLPAQCHGATIGGLCAARLHISGSVLLGASGVDGGRYLRIEMPSAVLAVSPAFSRPGRRTGDGRSPCD